MFYFGSLCLYTINIIYPNNKTYSHGKSILFVFGLVVEAFFLGADDKYLEIELNPYVFRCIYTLYLIFAVISSSVL